ncbi:hypothetical protein JOY44_30405 (plasmid) [Phormidium sp. CLA17]|nr:hypothetical protein [Leptolyngbya sp. Cla-17]
MKKQESAVVFDQERASAYDKRFAKLAPLRDAIHLLMHMIFSELPTDAHIVSYGKDVALLPPQKIEAIIASSGFDSPILFFQTLLIRA